MTAHISNHLAQLVLIPDEFGILKSADVYRESGDVQRSSKCFKNSVAMTLDCKDGGRFLVWFILCYRS